MMYNPIRVQTHVDNLHRRAEHARLVEHALSDHPANPLFAWAWRVLGQGFTHLGDWLGQPVCKPVKLAVVCGTTSQGETLVLSEC